MVGQLSYRALIAAISRSSECEITTVGPHPYLTDTQVRITNLNGGIPVPRGMEEINNYNFIVLNTGANTFKIKDPITKEFIDSTNFVPYVEGGNVNLIQQNFTYHRF